MIKNTMTAKRVLAAFMLAFVFGLARQAFAVAVFETQNNATDEAKVFVFGAPVDEGEIQTANLGSAESCADGRFAFRAGTVNVKAGGYVRVNGNETGVIEATGNWLGANAGVATLNIDGGTFWMDVSGASNTGAGVLRVAVNGGANTARLNLNGGVLRIDNYLHIGGTQWNSTAACAKDGEVNIRGGTAKIATLNLGASGDKGAAASVGGFAHATLNLAGGILEVAKFNFNAGHSQLFTWGAGTVKATAANVFSATTPASGCTRTVNVTGNPAVFDTGSFAQTIPAAIANGTGTLKLTGGNTVTLSAAPSFGLWLDGTTLVPAGGALSVPASGTFAFSGDATVDGSLVLGSGARIVYHVDDFLQRTAGTLTATGGFTLPQGVENVLDLVTVSGGAAVYEKSLSADGKTITVSRSGGSDFTWNGGTAANWGDHDVWMSGGAAASWADGNHALFATPNATVTLGGNDVSAASVAFNSDTVVNGTSSLAAPVVYVASGASATVGAQTSGTLEKVGGGALTLGSSRTAATTLTEGTLVMGNGTSLDWSNFVFGTDATRPVTLCLEPTATLANIPNSGTWIIGSVENGSTTVHKKGGDWTLPTGAYVAIGRVAGAKVAIYHEGGTWTLNDYLTIGSGASAQYHAESVYFEISGGTVRNLYNSENLSRTIIGGYGEATCVVTNTGSLVTRGHLTLGYNTGSVGKLKVVGGGTATIGRILRFGCGDSGGSGTLEVSDGGTVNVGDGLHFECNVNGKVVGGGTVTGDKIRFGHGCSGGSGTFEVSGGGVVNVGEVIFDSTNRAAFTVISLKSGGILSTQRAYLYKDNMGRAKLSFDGGTFRKSSADGNIVPVNGNAKTIDLEIGANGGTIDNNGLSIVIPRTITGTGGLRLTGSGKTTISVNQSYAGATTVASNTTLSVTNGCTFAGAVSLENGSALDIASYSVGVVSLTAASLLLPTGGRVSLTFNGGNFPMGSYEICSASGMTVAGVGGVLVPAMARGLTAGWRVVGDTLVLDVKPKGVAIIFR
jgi:hypothetical protein